MIKLLKTILNHFSNTKPEIIPEPVKENVPEISLEELFKESIANKLDEIFRVNHKAFFRPKQIHYRGFDDCKEPKELFIHNKFRFTRYRNEYKVEIYDPTEPALVELVYYIELTDTFDGVDHLYSKYFHGIWDEEFLETIDELVSIKNAERIIAAEKIEKERVQAEIDRKLAEEAKQERIRKMFTK